jgi:hypothetical protein
MEKSDSLLFSRENTAFSTETISTSFDQINTFISTNPYEFDIHQLRNCVDPDLLLGFGTYLEEIAQENITSQTTSQQIDEFNDRVFEKIKLWDLPEREVLNVALISKILENMEFTNVHMNEKLLRDQLFRHNDTYNLMYVWLDSFKKRLLKETKKD